MLQLFAIIVLIFSAVIHEYMHGWMADRLGDPTAKSMGRLTLNPIPHIDFFGSILIPLLLVLSGTGIVIGWAKPVPFNPYNLRDQKYGSAKVAIAGPLANLIVAVFFGLVIRIFGENLASINPSMLSLLGLIVFINLLLMIFNLVPIPPLDGSKVIEPFLPYNLRRTMAVLEPYGLILVLLFISVGWSIIMPIINVLFSLIVGT